MSKKYPDMIRKFSLLILLVYLAACTEQKPDAPEKWFTNIPTKTSGIDFINNLNETKDFNLFTWKYIYNGGGVAAGDINNDGLADLYFSGNANDNKLYLNKGEMQFEDITLSSKTGAPQGYKTGVSMVDINADGWLDLYVCRDAHPNENIRNNLVFINNQDNTFTEQGKALGLVDHGYSTQSVFFDMDQDNDLDLFLVNHPADFDKAIQMRVSRNENGKNQRITAPQSRAESYQLYENRDGQFVDITLEAGLDYQGFGLSALVHDFNEDGLPDLFVANDFVEPDVIFLNNGDRTFTESTDTYFDHMSQNSMGADIGDINNDSKLDLVVLDMLAATNQRQKIFATNMTQNRYERLENFGYGRQLMRNVLQLNTGQKKFSEVGYLAGIEKTDWSWSALFADLDRDGWQDLLITNGIKRDMSNKDFIDFNSDSIQRANQQGVDVFNRETVLDWIDLIPSTPQPNYLYRNNGDFTFTNMAMTEGMEEATFSHGAAYADLDNDGDLDVIINNMDLPASIYRNNAEQLNENHFLQVKLKGPGQNTFGIGATVQIQSGNQSQKAILQSSRGYLSSSEPSLFFGLGDQQTVDTLIIRWSDGFVQKGYGIQADQTIDLSYSPEGKARPTAPSRLRLIEKTSHFTHQENDFNDFKQEPLLFKPNSRQGPAMAFADVNNDGLEDLYIGGASGQPGAILLQMADGSFEENTDPFTGDQSSEDIDFLFFDLEGDGDQDLYVVSGGVEHGVAHEVYQDRLYINDGSGSFIKTQLPEMLYPGTSVAAADYDQDGDIDLFIGGGVLPGSYPGHSPSYLLENTSNQLIISDLIDPEGIITSALWHDYDDDGFDDLILAGEWMPLSVYKNQPGKGFKYMTRQLGLAQSHGLWNTLHLMDVNADGQPEIFAGNLGLNHPFEVSGNMPITAYMKDFDENGRTETIITHYPNGEEWPLPRKEMITGVLPHLRKKFLDNQSYSTARLEDIFSSEQLSTADKKQLKELRSGYFSMNKEQFSFTPLPNIGQTFPVFSAILDDLNADGVPDLLLGGNLTYAEVEQGPYDAGGGLILWGQRQNTTFDNSSYQFLKWEGDIRGLKVQTIQNQKTIWVAKSNGPLKSYNLHIQ